MVRGPRKHLKRLNAPRNWMLDKLSGKWAPRPRTGPHKLRESLPLLILLRNRLKYALTAREVIQILHQRLIKVDGKVRTDQKYPAGFMDVISIEKTNEYFRLMYDVKGRFAIKPISQTEADYKLARVRKVWKGKNGVVFAALSDSRVVRYPDPLIKPHDTVKYNLKEGKITSFVPFEAGNLSIIIGGRNLGRIGVIVKRERHLGGFDIVHVKDAVGHTFATRLQNVFVIGKGTKPLVSLPLGHGIRKTILEELSIRHKRLGHKGPNPADASV